MSSSSESISSDHHSGQASQAPAAMASTSKRRANNSKLSPAEELEVLIRARYPIIYVTSWEEDRVQSILEQIASKRNKKLFTWTITEGIVSAGSEVQRSKQASRTADPVAALDAVIDQMDASIYLFKDFHPFSSNDRCNISIHRRLRDAANRLRDTYKTIILLSPVLQIAPGLQKDLTVVNFDLPKPRDFDALLNRILDDVRTTSQIQIEISQSDRERLLHAARGLTLREAENVFAKTIVMDGSLTADDIDIVYSEKQQIIRKSGLLEYYETDERMAHVAGLENLKDWFRKRSIAFTERAAKFGLSAPRGVLLLGVQGCGKSLSAKAVSAMWRLPLLRFDLGRMFSSLVGSSEENVRQAIQTAESVSPVILWIDEIDKALSSAGGGGASDGGTSSRVFGTLLTWLSEKTSPVFVIATANDISNLPPELLRKGRLDEIFFVDLPNRVEREEIFRIHLLKRRRDAKLFDLPALATASEGFSGAEIEEAVISALFDAFSEKMDLTTKTILASIEGTVPLSRTMKEELQRLRNWASGRARPASRVDTTQAAEPRRKLEME